LSKRIVTHRCVIGSTMALPNQLVYQPALSSRQNGIWVGFCDGDTSHPAHFVVIKRDVRSQLKSLKSDIFHKVGKPSVSVRLFERIKKLRCQEGKCFISFQKKPTEKLGMDNADIYRCAGNLKGSGHRRHFVRIQHGLLDLKFKVDKKSFDIPAVVITLEK